MKSAGDALSDKFKEISFSKESITVLYDYLGKENEEGLSIEDLLVKQVQSPVRMEAIIRRLFENGVREFVEVGPGHALSGFIKKTAKAIGVDDYVIYAVETAEEFEEMLSKKTLSA
jgi:[acyl-carrier-protein] S-malonyltransferase